MSDPRHDLEDLSRWLDDELAEEELRALERQIADDPALRDTAHGVRDADVAFRRHAKAELETPVSLDTAAVIRRGFAERRRARSRGEALRRWMPLAASLLVLAGAALWMERIVSRDADARSTEIAQLVETAVQNALETAVSGSEVVVSRGNGGPDVLVVPIRTYRSETNHWCREFSEKIVSDGETITRTGVACREPEGRWLRIESAEPMTGQTL